MGLDYHPKVYPSRSCGGQYMNWKKYDILGVLQQMFDTGQLRLTNEGFIERAMDSKVIQHTTPWIHAKHLPCMHCYRDHHIKFNFFGYIPPRCMECWKIVVMPRTVAELFELHELQKDMNRASKCGIELRHYTTRMYGGYYYARSLTEGQHRWSEVQDAVHTEINPDIKVILKRGCTEMEMLVGPSDTWAIADNHLELDEYLNNYLKLDARTVQTAQGELSKRRIFQSWVDWAYAHGDETYQIFTDYKPLYPAPVTYHDQDEGAVKVQMAANKVMRLHGATPQSVGEAFKGMGQVMNDSKLGRNALGRIMGFDNISPFNIQGHDEYL